MKNRKGFVKILLDKGADPNIKNRVTDMPLIHATARSGNFKVLQLLLKKEGIETSLKDNEKRTILHWLAGVSKEKPGDNEKIENASVFFWSRTIFGRRTSTIGTVGETLLSTLQWKADSVIKEKDC
jgi:hypothetical protein